MKAEIPKSYDIIGNIAILKFSKDIKKKDKVKIAKKVLEEIKSVKTVLEKTGKVSGRLRKIKTNYLSGEKTKIAEYKENNCRFKFDVEEAYFSPRLSNERKEIAMQVKKGEKVLVMFAGVAPYSIVIAKNSEAEVVYSNEINVKASKSAEENVLLNKLKNVVVIQGDSKRISRRFADKKIKFDRIVMPRPQLKDTFLQSAFSIIKKSGIINYYGFSDNGAEVLKLIREEAKKAQKKIRLLKLKKAGDIAPFKFRWRVDFLVLN
ncbi:MAG: hypothetical protein WC533_03225 [Candidatus Pacearchaeota archaeon]